MGAACGDNCTTNSYTVTAADPGKTYIVAVRAGNQHGWSGWVNSAPAAPANPPPAAPASITVTRADGSVTASWPAVPGATRYHVTYTSDNKKSWSGPPCADNCAGTGVTFNASNHLAYHVAVRAGNAGGWSGWVNSAASSPSAPPPAPAQIRVQRSCDKYLHVGWSPVPGATGYDLNYSINGRKSWKRDKSNTPATGFQTHKANPNKTYWFAARALNSAGASGWTNSAAVAPPCAIHNLSASYAAGEISLAWNAANQADGYNVNFSPDGGDTWERVASGITAPSHSFNKDTQTTPYSSDFMVAVQAQQGSTTGHWYNAPVARLATPGIVFTPADGATVTEDSTGTYTIKLATEPTANVSIAIAAATGGSHDTNITVKDTDDSLTGDQTTPIVFNSTNWSTARTVTLAAAGDTDAVSGTRDITHTATSPDGDYSGITATLTATEDETTPRTLTVSGVTKSGATLTISPAGDPWYYQRIAPTGDSTCHSVPTGTTAVLSSLTAGEFHHYTAYRDSVCSPAKVLDSAYFTTTDYGVSNLAEAASAGSSACLLGYPTTANYQCAVSFATGSDTGGYLLKSVSGRFYDKGGSPAAISVAIHEDASGDPKATAEITLSGSDPDTAGLYTYTCTASATNDCDLDANTTYWAVMSTSDTSASKYYKWVATDSNAQTAHPGSNGWTIGDVMKNKIGANAWANFTANRTGMLHVAAYENATLAASSVAETTATLTLSDYSRNWWLKRASPADTTCKSMGTAATENLTTLTPGQAYTYEAYNDSGCTVAISSASFTTKALQVSSVTNTGMTLTIVGHTGDWYYQADTGPDSSACNGPVTTTTKDITGLTAGTTYTYTAYSDNACNAPVAVARAVNTRPLTFSPSVGVSIPEGGTATYTVQLATRPTANVTLAIAAAATGDTDITVKDTDDGATGDQTTAITFTAQNWNTARTVTLAAGEDTDILEENRQIVHTLTSADPVYNGITINYTAGETENDKGILFQTLSGVVTNNITVPEGGATTYLVRLSVPPTGTVSINVTQSGDSNISHPDQSAIPNFTKTIRTQIVTVSASGDSDDYEGSKAVTWTLSGGGYDGIAGTVTFTEVESTPNLTVSGITASGATLEVGSHSAAWYYKQTSPTAGSCTTVAGGTSTKTLSNLTANKIYAYTAYSGSGCTTEIDTAYFSTTDSGIGNLEETGTTAAVGNVSGTKTSRAMAFTTPNDTDQYRLTTVGLQFAAAVGSPSNITVAIHAADSSNSSNPAHAATATLSGSNPATAGMYTYTCSDASCNLAGNTKYFVVVSARHAPSGATYSLQLTTSGHQTKHPANNGWSLDSASRVKAGSAAWASESKRGLMHVAGNEIGTFNVSSVSATSATLALSDYTKAWSYKSVQPSSSCVNVAAGTTSAALTLTTDTFYAYEAYTGSGCTAANKMDTAYFATTDVFVTNLKGAYSTANPDTAQPPPGYSPVGRFSHNYGASNTDHKPGTKFTTGAVSGGNSKFTLKSVTGRFGDNNGAPSGMRFSLYSVGGSGNPDTELARLSSQRPLNSGWYTFTCTDGASGGFTSNCDLQPNTSYFVVAIIEDTGYTKWFRLRDTDSDADLTLPTTSGWSMANSRKQWTSGGYQQYWGVGTAGWFDRTEVPLLLIAADEKP